VAKIGVQIGLTLALKNRVDGATDYEFIRPSIEISDIDTEGDLSVKEQLAIAKKAIRPVWDLVDAAIEKLCEETFDK